MADANDKTDALVALAADLHEYADGCNAPYLKGIAYRIEALAAQPAGAVAEVVDVCGTGVKVPAWVGTGPAPDIPTGTKLYVGIPPAASVDVDALKGIASNLHDIAVGLFNVHRIWARQISGLAAQLSALINAAGGAKGRVPPGYTTDKDGSIVPGSVYDDDERNTPRAEQGGQEVGK